MARAKARRSVVPPTLEEQRKSLQRYLNNTVVNAKSRSKRLARPFTLTIDDILRLWDEQGGMCAYTGFPMTYQSGCRLTNASIERIDSTRGYTPDNVCLVQTAVNSMKMHASLEQFVEIAEAIAARREIIYDRYIRQGATHNEEETPLSDEGVFFVSNDSIVH